MDEKQLLEIIEKNHWVWDDLIDPIKLIELDRLTNESINWNFTNIANREIGKTYPPNIGKGSHIFWGSTLYSDMFNGFNDKPISNIPDEIWKLTQWLLGFISGKFENSNVNLREISINGQSMGMDGTTHIDVFDNVNLDYTLMYFPNSKWEEDWGGDFQFMKEGHGSEEHNKVLKSINYVPGRLILFKAFIPHRGLAPLKPYILRKSIVWRLSIKNLNFKYNT